jgi:hypothetical protein
MEEVNNKNIKFGQTTNDEKNQNNQGVYYDKLKPLRTYQGDVSNAIHKTKASVVSIAVAEENRRSRNLPEIESDSGIKNKFFIYGGVSLFVLGIIIVSIFYFLSSQNGVKQVVQNNALLNYDSEIKVSVGGISRDTLIQDFLAQEKSFNLPANSVLYFDTIYTIGTTTSASDVQTVLQTLAPQIPADLLRNLSTDYMFGVYSFDKNQPFIVLTVDDYGAGFSGMLKWESTMVSELGSIFNIASNGSPIGGYAFSDESLNNKNLRIVQNSSRQTVLLYSFINNSTIIITSNENTFNALLNKYLTGKMVK